VTYVSSYRTQDRRSFAPFFVSAALGAAQRENYKIKQSNTTKHFYYLSVYYQTYHTIMSGDEGEEEKNNAEVAGEEAAAKEEESTATFEPVVRTVFLYLQ
jgi:hypothetical protein